ncbi:ferredoxin [Actinosynnema sp. NPDC020468]|uniref:ferredoxin n=1 Tax=Actinosynnema sp. NPDC020468 TaxID=3154488 RepID=UPI0033EF8667
MSEVVRVRTDRERCVGAGQCVLLAPAVFDQGRDGRVVLLTRATTAVEEVEEAVDLCPAQAIGLGGESRRVGG